MRARVLLLAQTKQPTVLSKKKTFLIPYIHVDDLHIGPLTLHPFGLLVAIGVLLGTSLAARRARWLGLDVTELHSFVTWLLVGGFVGGHVFDSLLYHPTEVVARPWSLIFLWEGLSSFGGFAGGLIGVVLWKFFERAPKQQGRRLSFILFERRDVPRSILPFCDAVLAVFPIAWAFGRSGCAVVHDHPGARASARSLLAVAYGPGPAHAYGFFELRYGNAPRYDLGLLEMLFAVVLAFAFALTWKKRLPVGTYVIASSLFYAPVRFALDFLRVDDLDGGDPRYAALTPAQWACIALFGFGVALLLEPRWPRHRVAGCSSARRR